MIAGGCKKKANETPVITGKAPALKTLLGPVTAYDAIVSGSEITSALPLTEKGICYSGNNNHAPTTADDKIIADNSTTNNFVVSLTGLEPNSTYYARAYATNSAGTGYAEPITIQTLSGTVTDVDGNVYHPIKIGTQIWMQENLKVTHYRTIGNPVVQNIKGDWTNLNIPAYADYGDDQTNSDVYGRLYNGYAALRPDLVPEGWHVPSNAEWITLINFLASSGSSADPGVKLKEGSPAHWKAPNPPTNNESGFTALPSGYKSGSVFSGLHISTGFWSITPGNNNTLKEYYLGSGSTYLNNTTSNKNEGFSIRCIKDPN